MSIRFATHSRTGKRWTKILRKRGLYVLSLLHTLSRILASELIINASWLYLTWLWRDNKSMFVNLACTAEFSRESGKNNCQAHYRFPLFSDHCPTALCAVTTFVRTALPCTECPENRPVCQTPSKTQKDKETRPFVRLTVVRCVCQWRPTYGGRTAMLHRNLKGGIKFVINQ